MKRICFQQQFELKLSRKFDVVRKIYLAYDNSVLLISTQNRFLPFKLFHFRKQGKVQQLQQYCALYYYNSNIQNLVMIDNRTVAVLSLMKNCISIICLQTYNHKEVPLQHKIFPNSSLFYFQETRLICVTIQKENFILFYTLDGDLVRQFVRERDHRRKQYEYQKGDNHSLLIEAEYMKKQERQLVALYLYFVENERHVKFDASDTALCIRRSLYVLLPKINHLKLQSLDEVKDERQYPKQGLTKLNKVQLIERKMKCSRKTKGINIGQYSIYFYEDNDQCKYFIAQNEDETILCQSDVNSEKIEYSYALDYDKDVVVMPQYIKKIDTVIVTVLKLATFSEVYLHFVININEDFDDDLLLDSVGLLTQ